MCQRSLNRAIWIIAVLLVFVVSGAGVTAQTAASVPEYQIYAVEYAVLPQFPVSALVAGADRARHLDIVMMFWVIKGNGSTVLLDSGFYRDKFLHEWKPQNYTKPSEAIGKLGIKPEDVTDVILSHAHWDHADGVDLFPKAKVWIQKDEYQYYTGAAGQPDSDDSASSPQARRFNREKHGGIDPEDMMALLKANLDGRLHFVNGDDQPVLPGIRCYTGGKHTFQSQYCSVNTHSGTVVLASDNMYLYENLEKHAAIAQTLDSASNLRAQDRMKQFASKPSLIIPGHDPAVMQRFPKVFDGIVRID
jgi:glyoxylase-like metal-dependent hydrolase (beta-lactamase superfamily II)